LPFSLDADTETMLRLLMVRGLLILLFVMTIAEARSSAVTVEQIVALSQSGVSDAVLLALIERDHPVFPIALAPEQLGALRQAGVSEAVVIAMLKSPRAAPGVPGRAVEMRLPVGPEVLIVGHGPDVPNGSVEKTGAVLLFVIPAPSSFVVPLAIPGTEVTGGCLPTFDAPPVSEPAPSVGRFTGNSIGRFVSNGSIPAAAGTDGSLSAAHGCLASIPRHRMRRSR
jgi:hypothetical protein